MATSDGDLGAGPCGIGILCHPTYGGSGVVASELALALANRGHRVHLFSYAVPPRLARSSGSVEVHVAQGAPYPLFEAPPHDLAITSAILNVHEAEGLDVQSLRVWANSLVLRATQMGLVAAKGAGYAAGHPVGRWCREALFFLVWSCPQQVMAENLRELAGLSEAAG